MPCRSAKLSGITLLEGVEVDILEDGQLDLPDAVLARLDLDDLACRIAKAEGVLNTRSLAQLRPVKRRPKSAVSA